MVRVLFVCLGNICRSPLAEGVFNHLLASRGLKGRFECDSCGTSNYHIGESPDPRTVANAKENGITLSHHARQFSASDIHQFDYILAMDSSNMSNINKILDGSTVTNGKLVFLREFDDRRDTMDVPDPYYGGSNGFQQVFDIVQRSCQNLLAHLEEKHHE